MRRNRNMKKRTNYSKVGGKKRTRELWKFLEESMEKGIIKRKEIIQIWAVIDKNDELVIDQRAFYQNKDYAVSLVKQMNEAVVRNEKPYKVKKGYLVI